jgi:CheY-like chemotaxis protein
MFRQSCNGGLVGDILDGHAIGSRDYRGKKGCPMRVAKAIDTMLTTEGFNVYSTDLGEEGLDLGKLYDYDIILLDLNLPDMSGYDVLRQLRLAKVSTPVLILSGLDGIQNKVRGLGLAPMITSPSRFTRTNSSPACRPSSAARPTDRSVLNAAI